MPNLPAPALILREGDREELQSWIRSTSIRSGLAMRARIILLAAEGQANAWIASEVSTTPTTVWKWRGRYAADGIAGLFDESRSGRPKPVDDEEVITATLTPPPKEYGVTHWLTRLLAQHLKVGNATVARVWRKYGVKPWRAETFEFSTDPGLVGQGRRRGRSVSGTAGERSGPGRRRE